MAYEIERKFLVDHDLWDAFDKPEPVYLAQGYLCSGVGRTVRVRVCPFKGYLTIKGPSDHGKRAEFEYVIPREEALEILETLAQDKIEKRRYLVPFKGHVWEVDVFDGANAGLVVAEIELDDIDEDFALPEWVAQEVTEDHRYSNSSLAKEPFSAW